MADQFLYQGDTLVCQKRSDGFLEICLDNKKASVNKFNVETLEDLEKAVDKIKSLDSGSRPKGLLISSAKEAFVVGADITEFLPFFKHRTAAELDVWIKKTQQLYNAIEDLPFPTVALIHGVCLGGGFELALACSHRVASTKANVGLPETKLGIIPGWGGCVRLPRLIGADNALEWIAMGSTQNASAALRMGAVDAVVEASQLKEAGKMLAEEAQKAGPLSFQARRTEKVSPLTLRSAIEKAMVFQTARAVISQKAFPHYPAPLEALQVMEKTADLQRDPALDIERAAFIKLTKTSTAESLISLFLSDQFNKKQLKGFASKAKTVKKSAVLGAGIMGGGIAYQSASRGVPILMKDIQTKALTHGLEEAHKLLVRSLEQKKIDAPTMAKIGAAIVPTLSYGDFKDVDLVVEAVVESHQVKKTVLAEVEQQLRPDAVLTSNTSTLSIDLLSQGLKRPENFCGMHFFNPVHKMPLVEVIRAKQSSDQTIATVVQYASQLGKVPIVVRDCPGFLVNRVLFPYLWAFERVVAEGVEMERIDKIMERYGWPMGPAYLLDVIGMDTSLHAQSIIAKGYPGRLLLDGPSLLELMVKENRLGQKNGRGFYLYTADKKGRPKKEKDPEIKKLLAGFVKPNDKAQQMKDEDIIMRLMTPLINECVLCLQEEIVGSPMELDLALVNGLGFPPFLGGAMKFLDSYGLKRFCEEADQLKEKGPYYEVPELLRKHAAQGKNFYAS
ncbi:MAG: fatty acid oxidation complex subunit alpha FadB [Oligoflexales bacterium]|nr:fatty acid oxidation complex subunit alpha FadB [Oligoflexales bacterium]